VPLRALAAKALERSATTFCRLERLEALVVADRHPSEIHVVVTDIVNAAMGGPEMVEKLRRKRRASPWFSCRATPRRRLLKMPALQIDAILLNSPSRRKR